MRTFTNSKSRCEQTFHWAQLSNPSSSILWSSITSTFPFVARALFRNQRNDLGLLLLGASSVRVRPSVPKDRALNLLCYVNNSSPWCWIALRSQRSCNFITNFLKILLGSPTGLPLPRHLWENDIFLSRSWFSTVHGIGDTLSNEWRPASMEKLLMNKWMWSWTKFV